MSPHPSGPLRPSRPIPRPYLFPTASSYVTPTLSNSPASEATGVYVAESASVSALQSNGSLSGELSHRPKT